MARMRRNMMRQVRNEMSQSRAVAGMRPWRGTHGWRTAPPTVKGAIDRSMAELRETGPTMSRAVAGMRPWRGTHGWRTAPNDVKAQIDMSMTSMRNETDDIVSSNSDTRGARVGESDFPQRLRRKYGDGFPG
tara:strand:+ start:2548 stop:2943 length:396 start_codon:yes stop_codon:yes gene_type:complete